MSEEVRKAGIVSCSGEAIPEGTISRLATRRVLELLRPGSAVTICLPLFLAGNEAERGFARTHPTITVDGCEKQCARWGTEENSGPVSSALVVSEILGVKRTGCHRSARHASHADQEAIWVVAERIAAELDRVLSESPSSKAGNPGAQCACSAPLPGGDLVVRETPVNVPGLPLIFAQCAERGIPPDETGGPALLEAVRIYHYIPAGEEGDYLAALLPAYRGFRSACGRGK